MSRSWRAAAAGALLAIAGPAAALQLGELQVLSAIGEPLDLRIPLATRAGEDVQASCVTLVRDPASRVAGLPVLADAVVTIDTSAGSIVRIRTTPAVSEPAFAVHVRVACPGQAGAVERRYDALLDPRPGSPRVIQTPTLAATLRAQEGDTLRSFARRVFPESAQAQRQYLAAIRQANPAHAELADDAALPAGAGIALPDLRDFARPAQAAPKVSDAPRRRTAPRASRASTGSGVSKPASARAPARAPASAPRVAAKTAPPSGLSTGGGFELKLSAPEADLSRARVIDDRTRAQLRERLLLLDADDHVSALLALRNSVRQLEGQVAELRLRLSALPAMAPGAAAPAGTPPPAGSGSAPAPAAGTAPSAPTGVDAPAAAARPAEPPKADESAPAPTPGAKEDVATGRIAPPAAAKPAAVPFIPPASESWVPGVPNHWLAVAVGGLLLATALALLLLRRGGKRKVLEDEADFLIGERPAEAPKPELEHEELARELQDAHAPVPMPARAVSPEAGLSTRLPEDSRALRRRYIEERFPEIANRSLVLDDTASVVKGARLFYEDGAVPRAVELLQFCIEDNPQEVRFWLALFEIFRLERLTVEYAELAQRFKDAHGPGDYWTKVQFFGREIDPGNPLYREEAIDTLDTIGPAQARGIATAAMVDPIAENWLDAPMDFENEVLAIELRKALMAQARITESDLAANPMPALRNAQMFTVA